MIHRHEPPIASTPIHILHHDPMHGFIVVDKPSSIVGPGLCSTFCIPRPGTEVSLQPVHPTGRYSRTSLVEMLKNDFGLETVHRAIVVLITISTMAHVVTSAVNRLDRLTSGVMIIPLNVPVAKTLFAQFASGMVQKEYVARCKGKFPS